jgi:HlyD family secretion protein
MKTHKIGIVIGAVAVILAVVAGTVLLIPTKKISQATIEASPMDLTQIVTATGQVAGDEEADLAFDTAGTVAAVNVDVGDSVTAGEVLGSLSSDILNANLEGDQANVVAAQAQLSELEQGNRPQAVAVSQQSVSNAGATFAATIHDAYLKVQNAINNNSDILFNNPQSPNPVINIFTTNDTVKNSIDNERLVLAEKLVAWSAISGDDYSTSTQAVAADTLNYAKQFLTDLAAITTNLSTGNSGMSQTQIAADNAAVNAAASQANTGLSEYVAAQGVYNTATASLTLESASGTPEDLETQQAKVAAALAQVDLAQSQINHTIIRAPFDGIITAVNLKVGEVAVPGSPAFSIITPGLKVEVQIPENDISQITASDTASVTLDAYGPTTFFPAQVTEIDPAETVMNGVNSYKVTLQFVNEDPRIRSGMTANVSITTGQASQVIAVPSQAIITQTSTTAGNQTFVLLRKSDGTFAEQQVQTGITGSNGYTAIVSGLNDGDTIASFGQQPN